VSPEVLVFFFLSLYVSPCVEFFVMFSNKSMMIKGNLPNCDNCLINLYYIISVKKISPCIHLKDR